MSKGLIYKYVWSGLAIFFLSLSMADASYLLIPMEEDKQKNHLKAYGITYWVLQQEVEVDWLLNYRGGSFAMPYHKRIEKECKVRGVSFEVFADAQYTAIVEQINSPARNMDVMKLEKPPEIVVYSPKHKMPWDDAVTLVLTYAEIPYDVVYDDEVLAGKLPEYDWLHLHHEDFTGQYGKFFAFYRNAPWYKEEVRRQEETAAKHGFDKVSELKLAVVKKIRDFVAGGGFMFSMCSGTDSYDIALAAQEVDICAQMYDGDPADPNANKKLNYANTFAFTDFKLVMNPYQYEYADIDVTSSRSVPEALDFFSLFEFSAKWDPVPTMLTQNHTQTIKGFMGQTTAFRKSLVKPTVTILGEHKPAAEARYIYGEYGYGFFTFYGGHDPEDYRHHVGDPPTDLNLFPNSPGYRLILNNVLFPAARQKKQKT